MKKLLLVLLFLVLSVLVVYLKFKLAVEKKQNRAEVRRLAWIMGTSFADGLKKGYDIGWNKHDEAVSAYIKKKNAERPK